MEPNPRDVAMVRDFIKRKRTEREQYLRARLEAAQKDFDSILEMVIRDFQPVKIYQWGSLIDGASFQEISDIDLAVQGISDPAVFSRLCAQAEQLTGFPLHIVQLETVHPVHARNIVTNGRLVYER